MIRSINSNNNDFKPENKNYLNYFGYASKNLEYHPNGYALRMLSKIKKNIEIVNELIKKYEDDLILGHKSTSAIK